MPLSKESKDLLSLKLTELFTDSPGNTETDGSNAFDQFLTELRRLEATDPDFIIFLLQQTNNDGWTIGHVIACHQTDPKLIQYYIELLNSLRKRSPLAVLFILQQQDNDGWTVGHAIAYYRKESIMAYLQMLQDSVSFQPEQVFILLMSRLSDSGDIGLKAKITKMQGLTLEGMLTNKDQVQLYRKLLLATFDAIFTSQEVVSLLERLSNRRTVLRVIADSLIYPQVARAYLAALNNLKKNQPKNVIGFLGYQVDYGWAAGHVIARLQSSPKIIQRYVALLSSLAEKRPIDVIGLLRRQTVEGWTFGHTAARYQASPEVVLTYVALMKSLIKIDPMRAIPLLRQQTEGGSTVGHIIARYQTSSRSVQAYLLLLKSVAISHPREVFDLLQQQNNNHWLVGSLIVRYQEESIMTYLGVLQNLVFFQPAQVLELLISQLFMPCLDDPGHREQAPVPLRSALTKKDHILAYNKLFCDALVATFDAPITSRQIKDYLKYRDWLTEALLSISADDPGVIDLLRRCVNKNDVLGKYWHIGTTVEMLGFFAHTTKAVKRVWDRIQEMDKIKQAEQPSAGDVANICSAVEAESLEPIVGIETHSSAGTQISEEGEARQSVPSWLGFAGRG